VIFGVDDVCALFRDYAGLAGFPADATAQTLLFHPANRRMRLRITSPSFTAPQTPEEIRFDLHRTHLVGGGR